MKLAQLTEPQEISVLLVEDSSGDATAIMKAMVYGESFYDFRITRKDSLKEAIKYLDMSEVDVILLDLNLPDAKELKAINELHGQFPDLPIVVVSGQTDMDVIHQALRSGVQEFLIKGECSGTVIRQSVFQAITRKKIEKSYECGERL